MPDYLDVARKLREKAADSAVTPEESHALIQRAMYLETKYKKPAVEYIIHEDDPWREETANDYNIVVHGPGFKATWNTGVRSWATPDLDDIIDPMYREDNWE